MVSSAKLWKILEIIYPKEIPNKFVTHISIPTYPVNILKYLPNDPLAYYPQQTNVGEIYPPNDFHVIG